MLEKKYIDTDVCVVGGGIAGMLAAISAAREGARVVLMHERAVLGGNASSEIRMWICGSMTRDDRETGILEEIFLENAYRNPTKSYAIWDTVLYEIVKNEKNLTLLLNCTCMDAECERGEFSDGREVKIKSVTGYQMTTQKFIEVRAKNFIDCSGDSILAPLTNAEFRIGREAKSEYGENISLTKSDTLTMGMSCLIGARETDKSISYTPPSFAAKITADDARGRFSDLQNDKENFWYLELGGNRDCIGDTEEIRDELISLSTGFWDYVKNSGEVDSANWDVDFLGFLPGKRESRRMTGEYTITERDISGGVVFEDEVAYGGWPLDEHFPGGFFIRGSYYSSIEVNTPYSIPYRALYSKNVENLFFAGRNISMTHTAMSSIRVMATCGLLGEAVGRAAAIATKYGLTPNGVYKERLSELQESLLAGDCFLPSKKRKISDACKKAKLNAPDVLRNGEDRGHRIYNTDEESAQHIASEGDNIIYRFEKRLVRAVHIVFNSDLNRETLDGEKIERKRATKLLYKKNSPTLHLPSTLCKSFELYGELDGKRELILAVKNNRKRCYDVKIAKTYDTLILTLNEGRSNDKKIPIISFDFK